MASPLQLTSEMFTKSLNRMRGARIPPWSAVAIVATLCGCTTEEVGGLDADMDDVSLDGEADIGGDGDADVERVDDGDVEVCMETIDVVFVLDVSSSMAVLLRVIIHATDDTFLESPYSFSSAIPVQHTYAETLSTLRDGSIRVATFAARDGGSGDAVDVTPGLFTGYGEHLSIPEATSGQALDITEVGESISLSDAIVDFVEGEFCEEYVLY